MEIKDNRIDAGKAFDWGKTSEYYAKYRDIYPDEFYQRVADRGLCVKGQKVLDLGTGTGVLPRNMYRFGADWIGTDISPEQIEQAKRLAGESGMNIEFKTVSAEKIDFPSESFDVITACQCFWYFDHEKVAPEFARILKKDGKIVILFELEYHEEYDLNVPFTRESWHGRMFACRGIGASLPPEELARWDKEHRALLTDVPDEFYVKHYAAIAVLRKK